MFQNAARLPVSACTPSLFALCQRWPLPAPHPREACSELRGFAWAVSTLLPQKTLPAENAPWYSLDSEACVLLQKIIVYLQLTKGPGILANLFAYGLQTLIIPLIKAMV